MVTSTKAIMYIPFPVTSKEGDEAISSTHMSMPSDLQGWAKRLITDAENHETSFLQLSHAADDPDAYVFAFVGCPGDDGFTGVQEGKLFGFLTSLATIEQLHNATGFLLQEAAREARGKTKS